MTIEQAKTIDMVDYLSRIGYEPAKISGNSYWYHSPLHDEKTPSFKVNRKMNRWYDFADGKGGNLVDFGILFHRFSISDFFYVPGFGNSDKLHWRRTLVPNIYIQLFYSASC